MSLDYNRLQQRFALNVEQLKEKSKLLMIVNDVDLADAVDGLMRLQKTYKLESSDLALGVIDGKKTRNRLSAQELYVLGNEGRKLGKQIYFSREFMELAHEEIENDRDKYDEIDGAKIYKKLVLMNTINASNPHDEQFIRNRQVSAKKLQFLSDKLCNGEIFKSPSETKDLRCRFVANSHFSRIAPFKVEEANINPPVLIFHEVLSDNEIEIVKTLSKLRIERALVGLETPFVSSVRIAQLAWLDNDPHEVLKTISRRLEVSIYKSSY